MALSSKARKFMQVWTVFMGLMFFARCAEEAFPKLKVIMAKQRGAEPAAQAPRSAPPAPAR
jgi:hypothetical protein